MWVNQIFSLIANDNKIVNIIVADSYSVADIIAKDTIGLDAYAVDTTQYPVIMGDEYIDGMFYRGEVEVLRNPTADEDASMSLQKAIALEEHQVDVELDIDFRLCMLELGLV